MNNKDLPLPKHFNPDKVGEVWRVEYQNTASLASKWAKTHSLQPASEDNFRICLILVDVQNTFCIPGYELFVEGSSGRAAVDDNIRLSEFIYRNLHNITQIVPTMDTHQAMHLFHSIFFVDQDGNHPPPYTNISFQDIEDGKWMFNEKLTSNFNTDSNYIKQHLLHYTKELKKSGKYDLTIWPYHAMLGGLGHALVSSIEEAVFFHTIARLSQPYMHVKGDHPFTEHYSVLRPEVASGHDGNKLSTRNEALFGSESGPQSIYQKIHDFDAVIIAGQAKSHCVAWTIADLCSLLKDSNDELLERIYILEDCTSAVVIPEVVDYTAEADKAFREFSEVGIKIVRSTDPIHSWPGISV